MEHFTLRAIVDLLPRYAHARRAGWLPGRVALSEYLLLRRVAIERDHGPVPFAELRANVLDPYRTIDPVLDGLSRLVGLGLLERAGDAYALTSLGHDLLTRGERAANDYAAARPRRAAVAGT